MKCKNCGAEIVPGALRCPTCNIEYSKSDALVIPDTPADISVDNILINDIVEEPVEQGPKEPEVLEIKAIAMPEATEVTIPVVNEITEEKPAVAENTTPLKKGLLPEERGGNKLFLFFAILLLLSAGGFFIYANFVNPNIINEIMYYFNPELKIEDEKKDFESVTITFKELEKYNNEDGSYDLLNELLAFTYKSVKEIEDGRVVAYKATNVNKPLVEDGEEKIIEMLKQYTINDTFEISVTEVNEDIVIEFKAKTVAATATY